MGQLKLNGLEATHDSQLKTPKHDEMMKLLFNKKIINIIEKHSQINDLILRLSFDKNTKKIKLIKTEINLEVPLKTSRGFIVGIIDAVIAFYYEITYYDTFSETITTKNEIACCGIEIKPTINSIGEVMRQLKIYSDYLNINHYYNKKAKIILFTNDESEREIFESQGIGYISLNQLGDLNE